MRILAFVLCAALAACTPQADQAVSPNHPFVGCWESADSLAREVWSIDPSGWLFGYALNRNADGKITFFEQMRIENTDGTQTLIVTPQGSKPVGFARTKTDGSEFIFVNPAHDLPQKIQYWRTGNHLNAAISKLDGSDEIRFDKTACQ